MNTTLITIITLVALTTVVGLISNYCECGAADNKHYSNI